MTIARPQDRVTAGSGQLSGVVPFNDGAHPDDAAHAAAAASRVVGSPAYASLACGSARNQSRTRRALSQSAEPTSCTRTRAGLPGSAEA